MTTTTYTATNTSGGQPTESTLQLQAVIMSLVEAGESYAYIAENLGYSETYIRKLYQSLTAAVPIDEVDAHRQKQAARLERLYADTLKIFNCDQPLISAGQVVTSYVVDNAGNRVVDENGEYIIQRFVDNGLKLAAVDKLLKIMERQAKLLGLDRPYHVVVTTPPQPKSIDDFYASAVTH